MATSALKAAPKNAQKATEEEAPPNKSKKFIFIILGALLLCAAATGGTWYYMRGNAEGAVEAPKPPVFLVMDMFTVNLEVEDIPQYLQVGMTLQVADQDQMDQIKTYMPQVRSRILLLLSGKKAAELLSAEGKRQLAAEIIAKVRQPFTPGAEEVNVTDVFFTSFVVQ